MLIHGKPSARRRNLRREHRPVGWAGYTLTSAFVAQALLVGHLAVTAGGIAAIRTLGWKQPATLPVVAVRSAACLLVAALTFAAVEPSYLFSDFRIAYYPAGEAVLDGPAALAPLMEMGVHGFVNLPVVAYLFAPLAFLRLRLAIALFTVVGLLLALAAWLLLARVLDLRSGRRWLLLLLFAACGPLQYSIKEGNTSHWVLFSLALGLYLLQAGRRIGAGTVLGAAAVLKLPLLLFGLYFVLRRDWRSAVGFAAVFLFAVVASATLFGWSFLLHWYDICVRQFSSQWIAAFNVQSLESFMVRWHVAPDRLHDWAAVVPTTAERLMGYALVGFVYIVGVWCLIRRPSGLPARSRRTLEFVLVLCLALVSSPLSWSHYYAWLLLPAAVFLGSDSPFATGRAARLVGWTAVLLTIPLVRLLQFSDPTLMAGYIDIGVSHLLFAGLLWFGIAAWSLATGVGREATVPGCRIPSGWGKSPALGHSTGLLSLTFTHIPNSRVNP